MTLRRRTRKRKRARSKVRKTILWSSSSKTPNTLLPSPRTSNNDHDVDDVEDEHWWTLMNIDVQGEHWWTLRYDALSRKLQTQESEGVKSSERAENVEVAILIILVIFRSYCHDLDHLLIHRWGSWTLRMSWRWSDRISKLLRCNFCS